MAKEKDSTYIIFMAIVLSFIGFVIEDITHLIEYGSLDSRYYVLPFISSYGLIVPIWYFAYIKYPDKIYYENSKHRVIKNVCLFLILALGVFLVELIFGNLYEFLFKVELWNYTKLAFHVTKYASLYTSLGFGLFAFLLFKSFRKILLFLRKKDAKEFIRNLNIILLSLVLLDTLIFYINMIFYHRTVIYWEIVIK